MTFWDSVFNVVIEFIVDVVIDIIAIVVDEDRPAVPFGADEAAERSPAATAGSSEEAFGVFEALVCPKVDPYWGEAWGQGPC